MKRCNRGGRCHELRQGSSGLSGRKETDDNVLQETDNRSAIRSASHSSVDSEESELICAEVDEIRFVDESLSRCNVSRTLRTASEMNSFVQQIHKNTERRRLEAIFKIGKLDEIHFEDDASPSLHGPQRFRTANQLNKIALRIQEVLIEKQSTKLNTLEGNIVPSVAQAKSGSLEEDIGLSAGGLQIPKTRYSQPQNPGKNEKRVPTTITTRTTKRKRSPDANSISSSHSQLKDHCYVANFSEEIITSLGRLRLSRKCNASVRNTKALGEFTSSIGKSTKFQHMERGKRGMVNIPCVYNDEELTKSHSRARRRCRSTGPTATDIGSTDRGLAVRRGPVEKPGEIHDIESQPTRGTSQRRVGQKPIPKRKVRYTAKIPAMQLLEKVFGPDFHQPTGCNGDAIGDRCSILTQWGNRVPSITKMASSPCRQRISMLVSSPDTDGNMEL